MNLINSYAAYFLHSVIIDSVIYFQLIVHQISYCYENIHECSNGATSDDDSSITASHSPAAIIDD